MVFQTAFAKNLCFRRKIDDLRYWNCLVRIKVENEFVYNEKVSIFVFITI